MSLLRIRGMLRDPPLRASWSLTGAGLDFTHGESALTDLPQRVARVQLVIPAEQVLITRARVPGPARRHPGHVLSFAVEDRTASDPDANQVDWLGRAGEEAALAVVDKPGLAQWRAALEAAGVGDYEIVPETLLLPIAPGEWSLAWGGNEGFARTGPFEGIATDLGSRDSPPLVLRLLVENAAAQGSPPTCLCVYTTAPGAAPDLDAWSRDMGLPVRLAGAWDWRSAGPEAGASLASSRDRWRALRGITARLRPAAWIMAAALATHATALTLSWILLAHEQGNLRRQMESDFRSQFPDAVAVVDPALQMRRKLAEARHATGQPDEGDFLPMITLVAAAMGPLPDGSVLAVSHEAGRVTLELSALEESVHRELLARLSRSGLIVDESPVASPTGNARRMVTVRAP